MPAVGATSSAKRAAILLIDDSASPAASNGLPVVRTLGHVVGLATPEPAAAAWQGVGACGIPLRRV